MASQVESLSVGFRDDVSAGAKAAEQAINRVGEAAVATEQRVTRASKSGADLARQYGETERLTAKVQAITAKYARELEDLDRSELSVAEKERLRAAIMATQTEAIQRATAAHERWVAGMRAAEASTAGLSGGMAAATASATAWTRTMGAAAASAGTTAGALTAGMRATQAAAVAQDAAAGSSKRLNGAIGQLGFQVADVANQMAVGTSAFTAIGMQAGQFLGALGPMGAAIGAVVTVAGVLAGTMQKNAEATSEAQKATDLLTQAQRASMEVMETSVARTQRLRDERNWAAAATYQAAIAERELADALATTAALRARHDLDTQRAMFPNVETPGVAEAARLVERMDAAAAGTRQKLQEATDAAGRFADKLRQTGGYSGEEMDGLRERVEGVVGAYDDATARTIRLAEVRRELDAAVAAGIKTQAEADRILAAYTKHYDENTAAAKAATRAAEQREKVEERLAKRIVAAADAADAEAVREYNKVMAEGQRIVESVRTPAEAFAATQAHLNDLLRAGAIDADTYARAVQAADPAFQEATRAAETFAQDVSRVSKDVGQDLAENVWDQITGQAKADDALQFMKNWFKRLAVEVANQNFFTPITQQIVSAVPSLFGIQQSAGAGQSYTIATGANGQPTLVPQSSGMTGYVSGGASSIWNGGMYSQGLANAGTWIATSQFGQALGMSSVMTSADLAKAGVMGVQGGMQVGTASVNTLGSTFSQGLGYSPWGIVGSIGADLLGLGKGADPYAKMAFSTAGSIGGGMAGAAIGGATYGSIAGPIGAAIGALIGVALSSLVPADIDIPWGQVALAGGKVSASESLDDYDVSEMTKSTSQTNDAIVSIARVIGARDTGVQTGIGVNNGTLYTFVGGGGRAGYGATPDNMKTFGQDADAAFSDLILRTLQNMDLSAVSDDVKTALANTTAATVEDLTADLDVASTFRLWFEASRDGGNAVAEQVKQMMAAAKQAGDDARESLVDYRDRVVSLGLASEAELLPALRRSAEAMLGLGDASEPLSGVALITEQVRINFEALRPTLADLGYTAAEQADLLARATDKAVRAWQDQIDAVTRSGALTIARAIDPDAADPTTAAQALYALGLDSNQLPALTRGIQAFFDRVNAGVPDVDALNLAYAKLENNFLQGKLTQEQYAAGVSLLADRYTTAADAAQTAADAAKATAEAWAAVADSLAETRRALAMDQGLTTLSLADQRAQAMTELYATAATARAGGAEGLEAVGKVGALAEAALRASRQLNGSTAAYGADYDTIQALLASLEGMAASRAGMALGGVVGRFAAGGVVGNGIWNVDSVLARYAGGGAIALAGGEHVTRASSVTAETLPILDTINRTGRLPANDVLPHLAGVDRSGMEVVDELRALARTLSDRLKAVERELASYRREQAGRDTAFLEQDLRANALAQRLAAALDAHRSVQPPRSRFGT